MSQQPETSWFMAITSLAILFGNLDAARASIPEDHNLTVIKRELTAYHDSGEYEKDVRKVTTQAQYYLEQRLSEPHHKPLAIVFDIDETAISNFDNMKKRDFCGLEEEIRRSYQNTHPPALKPTLDLYRYAIDHQVAVFFVTARPEEFKEKTAETLKYAGYKQWNALILKSSSEQSVSNGVFKSNIRKNIEKKYDIVLNVGDQLTDLQGGHADRAYQLPNPYYRTY